MKRVRSKKIENDKKLSVMHEEEMDAAHIQEYTKITFTTGVEKEEEEEHHLKAVISGTEESIPTPKIVEKSTAKKRKEAHSSRDSSDSRDDKNNNNKSSAAQSTETVSCNVEYIWQSYLKDIGDVPNTPVIAPARMYSAIVDQEDGVPHAMHPYVCFRHREVKTVRKARKPDMSIEKIKKIKVDLQMMRRLAELTVQRDTYMVQHLNTIFSIFSICREMNKRLDIGVLNISESVLHDILFTKLISKSDLFYKKIPSFSNLYTCRKSIGTLRKLFKTGPAQDDAIAFTQKEMDYLNTYR